MSDIAYTIIVSLTIMLVTIYVVFACITLKKKEFFTAKNFKGMFAFCAVLCVLYFMRTVGGILLAQPSFNSSSNAICTVLYGFTAVLYLKMLKEEFNTNKSKENEKTKKDSSKKDK